MSVKHRMMRRDMTRYVTLTILFLACINVTFASNVLRVSTEKTLAGQKGTFSIVMQNDVAINGLNFIVKYDPNILTPAKVKLEGRSNTLIGPAGSLFGGDRISFLLYDTGMNKVSPDSGAIFVVEYMVSDSITESTSTEVRFVEGIAADSSLATVSFEYIDGLVEISPFVGVVDTASTIPRSFLLSQNYPNPFNPSTTIHFEIPASTHVALKVYNILGQEAMTVVNERREPGVYNVVIDASDMASGVYFYRLVAGDFIQTKKMLLIK